MAHRIRLIKVRSTHNNLRTDIIDGECYNLPAVGSQFMMWGPPLDPAAHVREVLTTKIKTVDRTGEGKMRFETQNSVYDLEIRDENRDANS